MTATILMGMLSISFWHTSDSISSHSFATLPPQLMHSFEWYHICILKVCFWHGTRGVQWDWDQGIEQARELNDIIVWKPVMASWEVCFGLFSCWKYLSPSSISNFSELSTTPSFKISQYCFASIFPSTSTSFPTPFQPIQPYIIRLFPLPCLTVSEVVWSDVGSPFFFHTYTFPSDPIQLILVSSLHNTLF